MTDLPPSEFNLPPGVRQRDIDPPLIEICIRCYEPSRDLDIEGRCPKCVDELEKGES